MIWRLAPDVIRSLEPGQCFVFGANTQGIHGKGAALTARRRFGAVQGRVGDMGTCYGLVTKSLRRPYPIEYVLWNIRDFLELAQRSPEREFLVTPVGCGLAGWTPQQIAPAFRVVTPNVRLPRVFVDVLRRTS